MIACAILHASSGLVILPSVASPRTKRAIKPSSRTCRARHKRLGELAGTWNVSVRYIIGDKQQEGKATCEAKMILGGRFLQQEYTSQFQGQPFHVLQILGYDNARKKSIEIMMDTMGTSVLHNEGTVSDDGKVITNSGESLDPQTGKPYKLRTVTTIIDHDNFTLEWFRIDDGWQGIQGRRDVAHAKKERSVSGHLPARERIASVLDLAAAWRSPAGRPAAGRAARGTPGPGTARRTASGSRAAGGDDRATGRPGGRRPRRSHSSREPRCRESGASPARGHAATRARP